MHKADTIRQNERRWERRTMRVMATTAMSFSLLAEMDKDVAVGVEDL